MARQGQRHTTFHMLLAKSRPPLVPPLLQQNNTHNHSLPLSLTLRVLSLLPLTNSLLSLLQATWNTGPTWPLLKVCGSSKKDKHSVKGKGKHSGTVVCMLVHGTCILHVPRRGGFV